MEPLELASFLSVVDEGFTVVPLHTTLQLDRETPCRSTSDLAIEPFSCSRVPPSVKQLVATLSSGSTVVGDSRRTAARPSSKASVVVQARWPHSKNFDDDSPVTRPTSHPNYRILWVVPSASLPTTTYADSNDSRVAPPNQRGPTSTSHFPTRY